MAFLSKKRLPARTQAHARKALARLTSKEDQEGRALVFMLERIKGKSLAQIAKEYNCCRATVDNYLQYGRQQNLVVNEARLIIGDKLIPKALAVYELHLEAGNLEAARDLVFGIGVLQKTSNVKHESSDADDTLDTFRDAYFKAKDAIVVAKNATPLLPETIPETIPETGTNEEGSEVHEPERFSRRRQSDLHDLHQEDRDE